MLILEPEGLLRNDFSTNKAREGKTPATTFYARISFTTLPWTSVKR